TLAGGLLLHATKRLLISRRHLAIFHVTRSGRVLAATGPRFGIGTFSFSIALFRLGHIQSGFNAKPRRRRQVELIRTGYPSHGSMTRKRGLASWRVEPALFPVCASLRLCVEVTAEYPAKKPEAGGMPDAVQFC